jgi:hypothetical protein
MLNPDKNIREFFYTALTDEGFAVYDTRQGQDKVLKYILLSTQSKTIELGNKCGYNFDATIVIEIIEYLPKQGNTTNRDWLNDAEEIVMQAYTNCEIEDFGLTVKNYTSTELSTYGVNEIINRKIITINLKLYQNEYNTN